MTHWEQQGHLLIVLPAPGIFGLLGGLMTGGRGPTHGVLGLYGAANNFYFFFNLPQAALKQLPQVTQMPNNTLNNPSEVARDVLL